MVSIDFRRTQTLMTALTYYYTKWLVYYQTNMIKPKIVPFKLSVEVS